MGRFGLDGVVVPMNTDEAEEEEPVCMASAAALASSYHMVLDALQYHARAFLADGELGAMADMVSLIAALTDVAQAMCSQYEGPKLSADLLHDLWHSTGLRCSDHSKIGSADTLSDFMSAVMVYNGKTEIAKAKARRSETDTSYRNGDRNTGPFDA